MRRRRDSRRLEVLDTRSSAPEFYYNCKPPSRTHTMSSDVFDVQAFKAREQERATLKTVLDPILSDIQRAEEAMSRLGICDDRGRRHLAQARVEILHVLADAQDKATSESERWHRMIAQSQQKY